MRYIPYSNTFIEFVRQISVISIGHTIRELQMVIPIFLYSMLRGLFTASILVAYE